MNRHALIGVAIAVAVALSWLSIEGGFYLQKGYSLSVSLNGGNGRVAHIDFPIWRQYLHVLLWLGAMVAAFTYIAGLHGAARTAFGVFATSSVVGMLDVWEYGTLGAPTSIWTILLLSLLVVLAKLQPTRGLPTA
jgi:hypothetical protein